MKKYKLIIKNNLRLWGLVFFTLLIVCPSLAYGAYFQTNQEDASISEELKGDLFWLGEKRAELKGRVAGEAFILGNKILIDQKVGRSIFAGGKEIVDLAGSEYNGFFAGLNVTTSGQYNQDLYIMGDDVLIKEGAVVSGDLRILANNIILEGSVKGNVFIEGGNLVVKPSSSVGGNLRLNVENGLLFEGGTVGLDLIYGSKNDPSGLEKMTIGGKVERIDRGQVRTGLYSFSFTRWMLTFIAFLGLCLFIVLLLPRLPKDVEHQIQERWLQAFWRGFLFLVGVPLLSLLFMFTGVGWQVGLIILLFYFLILMTASAVSSILFGRLLLNIVRQKELPLWVSAVFGALGIVSLGAIPNIGWIFSVLFFIGLYIPVLIAVMDWGRKRVG